MKLTEHARCRSQQRGVPEDVAQLIYVVGESKVVAGGAERLWISKREGKELIARHYKMIKAIERAMRGPELVAKDDVVITVSRPTKRRLGQRY